MQTLENPNFKQKKKKPKKEHYKNKQKPDCYNRLILQL